MRAKSCHSATIKPEGVKKGRGYAHKYKVLSLVDRDTGRQRSMVVDSLKAVDLTPILVANIAAEAVVMTDEASQYRALSTVFAAHGFTRHGAGQYVDYANPTIHTNTVEGAFSIFKRGMKGVYQHCAKKHLHRYVAEFEFRYTNRVPNPSRAGHEARICWAILLEEHELNITQIVLEAGCEAPRTSPIGSVTAWP